MKIEHDQQADAMYIRLAVLGGRKHLGAATEVEGIEPMSKAFALSAVRAKAGGVLRLTFADDAEFDVNLSATIERHPVLKPLADAAVFRRAKISQFGRSVTWGADDLELAADNLRARAVEQAGGYSHEPIVEWMDRNGMTQQVAADALGLSRRMLGYYLSGEQAVPRMVALACLGWDVEQRKAA